MDIYKTDLFKFVSGDMVKDRPATMTIKEVKIEALPSIKTGKEENKVILCFEESKKPLILNATNAKRLAKLFGRDTDAWAGQVVELYSEEVKAFGALHNAARIRESKLVKMAQTAKKQAAESTPAQRQERMKQNGAVMRPPVDDTAIGEDSPQDQDRARFVKRVMDAIPFYANDAQIWFALMQLEFEYNADTEEICFDALARVASKEADKQAA